MSTTKVNTSSVETEEKHTIIEEVSEDTNVVDPTLILSNEMVAKAKADVAAGTDRIYRIYTDGIFDLFHIGHMNVLKQAKYALGDATKVHLIAGVCSDADTIKYKGNVVMNETIRSDTVAHCKWVDEVVPNSPWVLTPEFITEHRIDFVAHDAIPYVSADSEDVYKGVKDMGKFLATERTDGISTTDIIVQIVRDYDVYVVRNLARGVDKKDLNVGKTWEIRAVAHEKGKKLDQNVEKFVEQKKELVDSIKALGRELDPITCRVSKTVKSKEMDRKLNTQRISQEAFAVAKHSINLCGAVVSTSLSVLSYLNIFSYIDKCKQTRQYKKQQ